MTAPNATTTTTGTAAMMVAHAMKKITATIVVRSTLGDGTGVPTAVAVILCTYAGADGPSTLGNFATNDVPTAQVVHILNVLDATQAGT